jgi:phosphoribosylformylglycinamidine cyclo-ligase
VAFNVAGLDVHDHVDEFSRTLGEELLEPTQIYAKDLLNLIKAVPVHSISHITGGGIAANVARVMPTGMALDIDRSTWTPHAIFAWLQARGNIEQIEAEKTFNMGIGMLAFLPESAAQLAITSLQASGLSAWVCGQVRIRNAGELGDAIAKGGNGGAVTLVGNYK